MSGAQTEGIGVWCTDRRDRRVVRGQSGSESNAQTKASLVSNSHSGYIGLRNKFITSSNTVPANNIIYCRLSFAVLFR